MVKGEPGQGADRRDGQLDKVTYETQPIKGTVAPYKDGYELKAVLRLDNSNETGPKINVEVQSTFPGDGGHGWRNLGGGDLFNGSINSELELGKENWDALEVEIRKTIATSGEGWKKAAGFSE